ncbi:MAG: glycosyl hydrolase [Acidobacteriaceae bacterium]
MKTAAFVLLCVVACAPLPAQNVSIVAQQFQHPAKAYRPMVRWWWPGGDVTDAELRREVGLLDQANFGGAEIQPFVIGLHSDMPAETRKRVDDYLTPTFYSHVQAALEEARDRGMWLDYTFGSGWPFGGAGVITPELSSVQLQSTHESIRGPVHFHARLQMPHLGEAITGNRNLPAGWLQRFQKREKLVAVVAIRGDVAQFYQSQSPNQQPAERLPGQLDPGTSVVLTSRMMPDGTLDWNVPPGTWQVFVFKEMPTGQQVTGGTGAGTQLVLDHMNRDAFDAYADRVGGTAKQYDGQFFGHGLRAIFCDSLEVQAYLYWNDDFLDQFRKRRGYDLTPYLPVLKVAGFSVPYGASPARLPTYDIAGIGDHVRQDYWQTVSDLMIENFYSPFIRWAADNNLLSRVQAHGSPTDLLRVYGASSIPETEDLYDNGRYDFLKMSSSAADLYGRKIVSSESFVWQGKAYQTTPEKIKRYADELLTAGINEIIYHGYPYDYMDRPEPGWHPFAANGSFSSHMNQHNPFWPYLPRLNQYITRVQYISQTGTTVVPVALYRGSLAYDSIEPAPPEPEIATRMMAAGYNYDHIDAYVLLHSKVVGGKLISPGGEAYSVLMLPYQKTVSTPVADQLTAFAHQGLPIVFLGGTPLAERNVVDGQLPVIAATNPLAKLLREKNVHATPDASGAVKILIADIQPNLQFGGESVPFIEKHIGALDIFFLRNPSSAEKLVTADFHATGSPEIWDPWTGEHHPFTRFKQNAGALRAYLEMAPYGSALLVFNPAAKPVAPSAPSSAVAVPAAQIEIGQNGWKFHGVGMGPGSQPETIDMELPELMDWTTNDKLKNFSGRGQYTTTFEIPAKYLAKHPHILLDLGDVKDVAEISINGKPGPVLLLRPYRAEVTTLLHAGENTLQVTVVNAQYNALAARGADRNFVPGPTDTVNDRMPSGLMGPVRLEGDVAQ